MDQQRSSLVVTIQSAEFAKEFHYFISVQLDGDQEKVTDTIIEPSDFIFAEKNRCLRMCD